MIKDYDEEVAETYLVQRALNELVNENEFWMTNLNKFYKMLPTARILYWRGVKKQAEAGVPAMVDLVSKVITLRLRG